MLRGEVPQELLPLLFALRSPASLGDGTTAGRRAPPEHSAQLAVVGQRSYESRRGRAFFFYQAKDESPAAPIRAGGGVLGDLDKISAHIPPRGEPEVFDILFDLVHTPLVVHPAALGKCFALFQSRGTEGRHRTAARLGEIRSCFFQHRPYICPDRDRELDH
jgi:hypothetical protein